MADVAAKKSGSTGERQRSVGPGGRGRPGRGAAEAPRDAGREPRMVEFDPWGALLEQLLDVPEEVKGADEGEGAAKRRK